MQVLGIGPRLIHTTSGHWFTTEESILVWAFRMTDMTRLTVSASLFQMDYTLVGRIFNHMSYYICGTHRSSVTIWLLKILWAKIPDVQRCNDWKNTKPKSWCSYSSIRFWNMWFWRWNQVLGLDWDALMLNVILKCGQQIFFFMTKLVLIK